MSATVVDHPLVKHHLTALRDANTAPPDVRRLVHRLASLLAHEATRDLTTEEQAVVTPICETTGHRLDQRIGLVPILRAGLGMVDPVLELIPESEVWHLGLYRDEATAQPVEYYNNLPTDHVVDLALILDPMLATGGSAIAACHALKKWGVSDLKLLSILAAPDGIAAVKDQFAEVDIFVCAIDERLDERNFIVPGLGDAGDRIFQT